MSPIQYFLLCFVPLLGVLLGIFLSYLSFEELPTGKRYFAWLRQLSLLIMISLFGYFYFSAYLFVFIILGIISAYFLFRIPLFALFFVFGSFMVNYYLALLIFIHLLFTGPFLTKQITLQKKLPWRKIFLELTSILIPLLLYACGAIMSYCALTFNFFT